MVSLFHAPGSARVLIFSSVGAAGLNLSIADVVIYFVRSPVFFVKEIRGRTESAFPPEPSVE